MSTLLEQQAEACKRELGISLPSPLRDHNIIIKHVSWTSRTASGLAIEHSDTLPRIWGVVLMVGAKVTEVQYADHIRFRRHAGEEMWINGEEYYMLNMADVECVISPEDGQ